MSLSPALTPDEVRTRRTSRPSWSSSTGRGTVPRGRAELCSRVHGGALRPRSRPQHAHARFTRFAFRAFREPLRETKRATPRRVDHSMALDAPLRVSDPLLALDAHFPNPRPRPPAAAPVPAPRAARPTPQGDDDADVPERVVDEEPPKPFSRPRRCRRRAGPANDAGSATRHAFRRSRRTSRAAAEDELRGDGRRSSGGDDVDARVGQVFRGAGRCRSVPSRPPRFIRGERATTASVRDPARP